MTGLETIVSASLGGQAAAAFWVRGLAQADHFEFVFGIFGR